MGKSRSATNFRRLGRFLSLKETKSSLVSIINILKIVNASQDNVEHGKNCTDEWFYFLWSTSKLISSLAISVLEYHTANDGMPCFSASQCFIRHRGVWLIVAGRGSKVAVAGPMSRSRVQSRGRGSNVAAGENDLGFEVTAEWKRLIWTQYKGKNSFLCTILHGSQFTGYGC